MKKTDIEFLLRWAYRDELPKQGGSAFSPWEPTGHGSSWRLILKYGAYGTEIDETKYPRGMADQLGPAPRLPPALGDPHPDSLVIAKRVGGLGKPFAALLTMHASMGTRPDWYPGPIRVSGIRDGSRWRIVGKNLGKSRGVSYYTEGSYCPLQYDPTLADIEHARGEYAAWHYGLGRLAKLLVGELTEHQPLPPTAAPEPWIEDIPKPRVFYRESAATSRNVRHAEAVLLTDY